MITWITHPEYDIPLPPGHRFTSTKFSDLFELLKKSEYRESATVLLLEKAKQLRVELHSRLEAVLRLGGSTTGLEFSS